MIGLHQIELAFNLQVPINFFPVLPIIVNLRTTVSEKLGKKVFPS